MERLEKTDPVKKSWEQAFLDAEDHADEARRTHDKLREESERQGAPRQEQADSGRQALTDATLAAQTRAQEAQSAFDDIQHRMPRELAQRRFALMNEWLEPLRKHFGVSTDESPAGADREAHASR
jgi:hypothetical protein